MPLLHLVPCTAQAGPGALLPWDLVVVDQEDDVLRIASVFVSGLAVATTLAWDTSPIDTTPAEQPVRRMHVVVKGGMPSSGTLNAAFFGLPCAVYPSVLRM